MRITFNALGTLAAILLAAPLVGCAGDTTSDRSALSGEGSDGGSASGDCTYTQGYWKNHPDVWPVSSIELGSVTYTKAELLAIFETPVKGNGLISLAHQLIAAKLNIAAGASDASIKTAIQQADALIGSLVSPPKGNGYLAPSATSSLTDKLDAFNSGNIGPGHCGENGGGGGSGCDSGNCTPGPVCGNGVVETGETCDDGNTVSGDGCSSTCQCEDHAPVCGNGIVETGETCDDGNTVNGDGCSSTCQCEPVAVCGNGIVEAGEQCDDGNTINGDGCSSACLCETSTNPT